MLALLWGHWDLGLLVWSDSIKSSNNFRTDFPLKMPLKKFLPGGDLELCRKVPILLLSCRVESIYSGGGEWRVGLIKIIAND